MLVEKWMSKDAVTIDQDDSMQSAIRLLKTHSIRMLPVMSGRHLVGVVTDRDLKRASASDANLLEVHELFYLLARLKVRDVMTRDPVTVPVDFTIEETAEILAEKRISGVPVLDLQGRLAGVITKSDLFETLISLTGLRKKGLQLALQLEDKAGSIKAVCDVIRGFGGRLVSILTAYDRVPEGCRNVYIRTYGIDRLDLNPLRSALNDKGRLLYLVDHRAGERTVFGA